MTGERAGEKREARGGGEPTRPGKFYAPDTDIYETGEALVVVMDMPGVDRESLEVTLDKNVLTVDGQIDFSLYDGLAPLHTEYNVGHFSRSFTLSSKIDQAAISAAMQGGVLTLTLPKVKEAAPRRIEVG